MTLSRMVALPPFLWLLVAVARERAVSTGAILAVLYLFLALSDFLDGPLARRAGAASPKWGTIDVVADILFNLTSLTIAWCLGLVGVWVPAGVALLGGRFLARLLTAGSSAEAPRIEDQAGKLAGVFYYLLVGLVVLQVVTDWPGPTSVARAGDLVFAYTLYAFWRGRTRGPQPRERMSS